MSIEALVAAIEAEASAEVECMLADADATARARVAEAEAAAGARVAATLAEAEPSILGAEVRRLNAARLVLAERRAALLAARSDEAFTLAERHLAEIAEDGADPERWAAAVRRLADEAAYLAGSGEIRVRPRDAPLLAGSQGRVGTSGAALIVDATMPPGVRARSEDGRLTVDATIPVRLARARAALLPEVVAILRGRSASGGVVPKAELATGARP